MLEKTFQSYGDNLTANIAALGHNSQNDAADNRTFLQSPEVSELNRQVLTVLYHALVWSYPAAGDILRLESVAIDACSANRVVATHPWLLPYYCALSLPAVAHESARTGQRYFLVYRGVRQQRVFIAHDWGRRASVKVPRSIQPHLVNLTTQPASYKPENTGSGARGFLLSYEAARDLARRWPTVPSP